MCVVYVAGTEMPAETNEDVRAVQAALHAAGRVYTRIWRRNADHSVPTEWVIYADVG